MGRLILFFVILVCVCVSFSPLLYFKGTAKGRRTADHIKTMTRVRKYLIRGEEARAATCLETFMKAHGDVPDMLALLAEITQDPHQKMTLADRALALDATHPGAFLQRGLGALCVGGNAAAEESSWPPSPTRARAKTRLSCVLPDVLWRPHSPRISARHDDHNIAKAL